MRFPACGETAIAEGGGTAVSAAYFRNLRGDQVIDDVAGVKLPDGVELPKVTNLRR